MEWVQENWINLFFAFVFISLIVRGPISRRINGVGSISASELASKYKAGGIVLVDCRTPGEFATAHIKGAKLISTSDLVRNADKYSVEFKGKEVAVICASGGRSVSGAVALKKAGLETVYNVQGGMFVCGRSDRFSIQKG